MKYGKIVGASLLAFALTAAGCGDESEWSEEDADVVVESAEEIPLGERVDELGGTYSCKIGTLAYTDYAYDSDKVSATQTSTGCKVPVGANVKLYFSYNFKDRVDGNEDKKYGDFVEYGFYYGYPEPARELVKDFRSQTDSTSGKISSSGIPCPTKAGSEKYSIRVAVMSDGPAKNASLTNKKYSFKVTTYVP